MISKDFTVADDVKEVGDRLIHNDFTHLLGIRVEYVFSEKQMTKGGMEIWGKAQKVGSLNAFLAGGPAAKEDGETEAFFAIVISRPVWDRLLDQPREALVFHELCHLGVMRDEEGSVKSISIIPHDLEEFEKVVHRYGLWRESVRTFLDAARSEEDGREVAERAS